MPDAPRIVSDVMSHNVIAIGRNAPFKEIVQLINQW